MTIKPRNFFSRLTLGLTLLISLPLLSPEAKNASGPKEGQSAPAFTLRTLDGGRELNLSTLKGKPVLIDFWASWCPPCLRSLPELNKLAEENPQVAVLAINIDDKKKNALDFWGRDKKHATPLYDKDKKVVAAYDIRGMPTAFLLDAKGLVVKRFDGYSVETLSEIQQGLLKLSSQN